jgi:hypothetical protein
MPAAFECWNDAGYTQIDSQYPNLRLAQKGTVYCDQAIPGDLATAGQCFYRDIAVSAANPVIAFRCGTHCASVGIGFDGSTYNHRFYTRGQAFVDYWCFADAPAPITAGLEVYNQAGQLVFTSKDRPAKVIGNYQAPTLPRGGSVEFGVAGAARLAIIQNSATFGLFAAPIRAPIWAYQARITDAATLSIAFNTISVAPPAYGGADLFPTNNNYTLLDTAGQ